MSRRTASAKHASGSSNNGFAPSNGGGEVSLTALLAGADTTGTAVADTCAKRPNRQSAVAAAHTLHKLARRELHGHSHAAPSEGGHGEAAAGDSTSGGESFEGEGPMEETEVVAPDGTVIKCFYRGVSPSLVPHSREWKKEKRLADNRASAARSRALQRVRVTDMSAQLNALVEANKRLQAENAKLRAALGTTSGSAASVEAAAPAAAVAPQVVAAATRGAVLRVPRGRSARAPLSRTDSEHSGGTHTSITIVAAEVDISSASASDSDALSMRKRHAPIAPPPAAPSSTQGTPALLPLDDSDVEEDVDMMRDVLASDVLGVTTTSRRPSSHAAAGATSPLSDTTASISSDAPFVNTGAQAPHLPMPAEGDLAREFTMASVLSPHMRSDAEMAQGASGIMEQQQSFARMLSLSIPDCASPHMLAPTTVASPMVPTSSFWSSFQLTAAPSVPHLAGSKRRAEEDVASIAATSDAPCSLTSPTRSQFKRPHMAHMLAVIACVALLMALPTSGVIGGSASAGDSGLVLTRTTAVAARRLLSVDAHIGAVAHNMVHASIVHAVAARPVVPNIASESSQRYSASMAAAGQAGAAPRFMTVEAMGRSVFDGASSAGVSFMLHYARWLMIVAAAVLVFEAVRYGLWRWRDSRRAAATKTAQPAAQAPCHSA